MIGNDNIEIKSSKTVLGVLMGKHVFWVNHVRIVEFEIAKNIGLLHHISQFLNENYFKTVCFSYIYSSLRYATMGWVRTYATKLKRVYLKQKHPVQIVFNKEKLAHSKQHFENLNELNIYQIKISKTEPLCTNLAIKRFHQYSVISKKTWP